MLRIGVLNCVLANMIFFGVKKLNIQYVFILLVFISSFSLAEDMEKEGIFSDRYLGYLQFNTYAPVEETAYSKPKLSAKIGSRTLMTECMGGNDCVEVVYYKKIRKQGENVFFLVKDERKKEIWILGGERESYDFDAGILSMGGNNLILSDDFDLTDTSFEDGAPDLTNQRVMEFNKILDKISPVHGAISFNLPGGLDHLGVTPSYLSPGSAVKLYPVNKLLPADALSDNKDFVLEVFKREGDYWLAAFPGDEQFGAYQSGGVERVANSYLWVSMKDLKSAFVLQPTELNDSFFNDSGSNSLITYSTYGVVEGKVFNGNLYGLVQTEIYIDDPFAKPSSGESIESKSYQIVFKWMKLRDDKGRLRFWFSDAYGC